VELSTTAVFADLSSYFRIRPAILYGDMLRLVGL